MIDLDEKKGREGDTLRPKSRDAKPLKKQRKWAISGTDTAHCARFVPVFADDGASIRAKSVKSTEALTWL